MWPDPTQAPGGLGALVKPVYHVWGKFQTASGAADPGAGVWRTGAVLHGVQRTCVQRAMAAACGELRAARSTEQWWCLASEGLDARSHAQAH
jgi:hypothetical protein